MTDAAYVLRHDTFRVLWVDPSGRWRVILDHDGHCELVVGGSAPEALSLARVVLETRDRILEAW